MTAIADDDHRSLRLPASRPRAFRIRIDDEYMNVTGGFGTTTWTVHARCRMARRPQTHVTSSDRALGRRPERRDLRGTRRRRRSSSAGRSSSTAARRSRNGALNTYNGQATLYLSGDVLGDGKLCGGVVRQQLRLRDLEPEHGVLTIVANGNGGQRRPAATASSFDNNTGFQGALYRTSAIEFGNNADLGGPIVGSQISSRTT